MSTLPARFLGRVGLVALPLLALLAACGGAAVPPSAALPTPPSATPAPTAPPTPRPTPTEPAVPQLRTLAARRDFYVGAAVSADALRADAEYARVLAESYNQLTPENVMKFGLIHPARDRYDWAPADALVDFAEAHGMRVHGHTLLWHQELPGWVTAGKFTPEAARAALHDHIAQVVGRYKGRIAEWDVVNEAIGDGGAPRDTPWRQLIGPEYIELAFRWAHEADPDAKLFYNDYNGEELNAKSDAIFALVRDLKSRGVPIDGVGLQMHISLAGRPDTDALARNMRRLADLGLLVHVSEMDVRVPIPADAGTLKSQGRAFREVLQVCLAAPNCHEFTTWGFTDKYSWVPGFFPGFGAALPFDEQLRPKPAYAALMEALR
ncbi:endo-1,4-beta-xylanase [Kouleothrix sp.]|uniref:endo-1,4-beta-xylanase n=1 Tax=Kouleothrix sp. TaxID=2779161 RepID=UPI00391AA55D